MDSAPNVHFSSYKKSVGLLAQLYVSAKQVFKCKTYLTLNVYGCFSSLGALRLCSTVFSGVTCCQG